MFEKTKRAIQSMLRVETNGPRTAFHDQELFFYNKYFLRYYCKNLGDRHEATNVLTSPGPVYV